MASATNAQIAAALADSKLVRIRTGHGYFPGIILEDRGRLGPDGKNIYRVAAFPDDPDQRAEFEVAEDRIELDAA